MFKRFISLFHPDRFQGWAYSKKYFEGWYYKIVDHSEENAFAIIPGIAMDGQGNKQAFIQLLDGKKNSSDDIRFDFNKFITKSSEFYVSIENNSFSNRHINVDLPDFKGSLSFTNNLKWPSKWYSPGIMGPYSFVPFMECYHGILSMNHTISGKIWYKGKEIDFTNGRGYMEKDWGHSFPEAYCWMQSNHFSEEGISIKSSVAKIPWLGNSFIGFIAGIWFNNELIQFTSYNRSKLVKSEVTKENVLQVMENKKYKLTIKAKRSPSSPLASPIGGLMDGKIDESMTSEIEVILYNKKLQKIIFNDVGRNACLEVAGNVPEIIVM